MENLCVFLAVAGIIDFDRGHKNCQFCIVKFCPQQVYDVSVVNGATVAILNVDCILKLAIKDLEFHGPLITVRKGLQRFLGLVDIHVLHCRVMEPILECFNINLAIVFIDLRFNVCVCMRCF